MNAEAFDIQNVEKGTDRNQDEAMEELASIITQRQSLFRLIALRYLRNPADAEDAVQDAFLSAVRHLKQFKRQAQLSTWLTAIVTNSARMKLRQRRRFYRLFWTRAPKKNRSILPRSDCLT